MVTENGDGGAVDRTLFHLSPPWALGTVGTVFTGSNCFLIPLSRDVLGHEDARIRLLINAVYILKGRRHANTLSPGNQRRESISRDPEASLQDHNILLILLKLYYW